jgi:hypothetical protein
MELTGTRNYEYIIYECRGCYLTARQRGVRAMVGDTGNEKKLPLQGGIKRHGSGVLNQSLSEILEAPTVNLTLRLCCGSGAVRSDADRGCSSKNSRTSEIALYNRKMSLRYTESVPHFHPKSVKGVPVNSSSQTAFIWIPRAVETYSTESRLVLVFGPCAPATNANS